MRANLDPTKGVGRLRQQDGKGSRQNGSVTLGKGLALRAGHGGPSPEPVGCRWTARATPAVRLDPCLSSDVLTRLPSQSRGKRIVGLFEVGFLCYAWLTRGKTNLSHDGLNPAHVPYWWVNNPTLGEFCFTMIGRADIEGSKSNVAMNAWLPQASYPCGNFSDTSSFEFRRSKGSLGHAFTVRIRTGNQNQTSFYPSVPHEISVLVELILGHLRYLLTDVPPQPNSPPDNVFRPDRPPERALGPKSGEIPLVRTSSELAVRHAGKDPEGTVPSPSPGQHAATRSRHGSSSSSPPTADGFVTGTPVPSPQSQSFSRSYGSILPTSLAYIVPSTRGCSPWRPDAVMSTTGRGRHSVLRIFKGRRERTGHHATCGALPAAGPYLRLSRFQGVQAVKQKR
ncbi:Regulator of rDNA transcription protein 15 [Capsicum baccatum]|uniref:Regulator of rDNA transcription protein 15 n=1 Tax=Capsicum baccatum TaxID=33114 RepID=A0A2G2UW22_CAPBA|nr:Regulator of rDNA transcription protein 15 [Capsicum baccatum]